MKRTSTGIPELDHNLGGGLPDRGMGIIYYDTEATLNRILSGMLLNRPGDQAVTLALLDKDVAYEGCTMLQLDNPVAPGQLVVEAIKLTPRAPFSVFFVDDRLIKQEETAVPYHAVARTYQALRSSFMCGQMFGWLLVQGAHGFERLSLADTAIEVDRNTINLIKNRWGHRDRQFDYSPEKLEWPAVAVST